MVAICLGQSAKYKGFAEQCMAEYDIDGWTVPILINPDDINLVMKTETEYPNMSLLTERNPILSKAFPTFDTSRFSVRIGRFAARNCGYSAA